MNLKKEFIIVFHPYVNEWNFRPFRYKVISINRLPDYIGAKWTAYLTAKLLEMQGDKDKFKIRRKGVIYAYKK